MSPATARLLIDLVAGRAGRGPGTPGPPNWHWHWQGALRDQAGAGHRLRLLITGMTRMIVNHHKTNYSSQCLTVPPASDLNHGSTAARSAPRPPPQPAPGWGPRTNRDITMSRPSLALANNQTLTALQVTLAFLVSTLVCYLVASIY